MKHLVACLLACLALTFARPVLACWDGWSAAVGKVELLQAGNEAWNPATAREVALWGGRIDAMLPAGGALTSEHGKFELSDGAGVTTPGSWDGVHLESLFKLAAKILGRRAQARDGARDGTALTVQLFAARSQSNADAFTAQLEAKAEAAQLGEPDGVFYTAGGYPANHAVAHVVLERDDGGAPIYRVLVGAFLDRSKAEAARRSLRDTVHAAGFVREL
jgi:hypothetical protein